MSTAFCISSKTANGLDVHGLSDQIVTKVKAQISVLVLSFDGDPCYNFCHDDFSSGGSPIIIKMGEI
jgi:hypothetical protein